MEKKAFESHLQNITSSNRRKNNDLNLESIKNTFLERVEGVRDKIGTKKSHDNTAGFVLQICNIEQMLWKEAAKK